MSVSGVWQVSMLNSRTDIIDTSILLVSHYTPLGAFLPFFGQTVRIVSLAHGTSAHLVEAFVGTLVPNQNTWEMLNTLVMYDLVHRLGESNTRRCSVLGRLEPLGDFVRAIGGSKDNVHRKESGDLSYRSLVQKKSLRHAHGIWHVDIPYADTDTNPIVTTTSASTSLISHLTSLNIVLPPSAQAVRVDTLAPGTSEPLRKVFLGALVGDQDTWKILNEFIIDDIVPKNDWKGQRILAPQQLQILGRLALVGFLPVDSSSDSGRGKDDVEPEIPGAVHPKYSPIHIMQPLPRPDSPQTLREGKTEIENPVVDPQISDSPHGRNGTLGPGAQEGVSEPVAILVSDKETNPEGPTANSKTQDYFWFAAGVLDKVVFHIEEARTAIRAAMAPLGENKLPKWILGFLAELFFSIFGFILVISCLLWARRDGRHYKSS